MNILSKKKFAVIITSAVLIAVVVLLSAVTVFARKEIPKETEAPAGTPVKVLKPQFGSLERELKLTGYVESNEIVTVLPFVSGTLESLAKTAGDSVEKGEVIAEIDSKSYDLQLKQAEAAYFGIQSSYERIEQMYNSGAATRQNYDQTKSQYDAYKSQYELAQLQVSYTHIEAPISGTVLKVHTTEGAMAAPEIPVMTIGNLKNLIVKLRVPEKYYELFSKNPDMKVTVSKDGLTAFHTAEISEISPMINAQTRNFDIVAGINDKEAELRPGMFVYCIFETDRQDGLWYLPHSVYGPGNSLWIVNHADETAEKISFDEVYSNNRFFAVPEKYSDSDFIIEGQSFLVEGSPVSIR